MKEGCSKKILQQSSFYPEDQITMQIDHLRQLFGRPHVDQKEKAFSERKQIYGEAWKLFDDPFLLHMRLKKIAPIPYTEYPSRTRFQIYPYASDWQGANASNASKARYEGFGWAWVRFKAHGFIAHNLTDFMEIRFVTEEIRYLSRHWISEHRDKHTNGSQEMPPFKTPEWEIMLKNQPSWRHIYLRKEASYMIYKVAPSWIRADPLFYPTERRWTWAQWELLKAKDARISYNFPKLPVGEYSTLSQFQTAMINLIESWSLIPDPAMVATCRFLKVILLLTKLQNYDALECKSMKMVFVLSKTPEVHQILHYFSKVKYIGGNYVITFEDMLDTRFWDPVEELYLTRHTPDPIKRYEACFSDKTLRKRTTTSLRGAFIHS